MLSLDVDNENPDPNKDLRSRLLALSLQAAQPCHRLSTATVHSSGALLLDSSMHGILGERQCSCWLPLV